MTGRSPGRLGVALAAALVCASCTEVPADAPPPSRAEQLRRRGAELVQGRTPAPPVEVSGEPLSAPERADVAALGELMAAPVDPVDAALPAVDDAVERDLPVRAAELLRATAIPAARELVARAEAIEPTTDLGVALRRQWLAAQSQRVAALEAYAAALERGIVEDLVLADALRDQRLAVTALSGAREAYAAAQRRIDASAEGE